MSKRAPTVSVPWKAETATAPKAVPDRALRLRRVSGPVSGRSRKLLSFKFRCLSTVQ